MTLKSQSVLLGQFSHIHLIEFGYHLDPNIDPDQSILFSDNWPDGKIFELAENGPFKTFLNSNNKNFDSELLTALKVQNDPHAFMNNPLNSLFDTTPNSLILPFIIKEDKQHLIIQIESFLKILGSRIVTDQVRILFEELFMNAVFDAPSESKKMGLNFKKKKSEFILAFDSEKLIISCIDFYGSLDSTKMVKRMRDIYSHGTKNIINLGQRKGGAGIGCSLLYQNSSSMIIGVERGLKTRVTCTVPLKMSHKNFVNLGKNLQIITLKP